MSDETKTDDFGFGSVIGIIICFFFFGLAAGCGLEDHFMRAPMQAKAVELGVAEWHVDQKTGTVEFKWKDGTAP